MRRTASKKSSAAKAEVAAGPDLSPRPRIQDVASAAGVSLGTVSAVLNDNGRIADSTRERVRKAMEELGYRPNLYASNLARRQSRLLGVVVSNLQNPFFAETAQAIEEEAAACGFQISLTATNFSPLRQRAAVQQMLAARVAGLAVITSEYDAAAHAMAVNSRVPTIFLDTGQVSETNSVLRVDASGGMRAAVSHLLDLGHRDLLFVRNSQQGNRKALLSHRLRNRGFATAVRKHRHRGLRATVIDRNGPGPQAGEAAIASVLGSIPFTAVIAITDMVALGVCRGLQARGLRIPLDVSVVGFDNTYFSPFLNPPLTTVDVPRSELSRLVVLALTGAGPHGVVPLPTSLVVRQSTGPPPNRSRAGDLIGN